MSVFDFAIFTGAKTYKENTCYEFEALYNCGVQTMHADGPDKHNQILQKCVENEKNGVRSFVWLVLGVDVNHTYEIYTEPHIQEILSETEYLRLIQKYNRAREWIRLRKFAVDLTIRDIEGYERQKYLFEQRIFNIEHDLKNDKILNVEEAIRYLEHYKQHVESLQDRIHLLECRHEELLSF